MKLFGGKDVVTVAEELTQGLKLDMFANQFNRWDSAEDVEEYLQKADAALVVVQQRLDKIAAIPLEISVAIDVPLFEDWSTIRPKDDVYWQNEEVITDCDSLWELICDRLWLDMFKLQAWFWVRGLQNGTSDELSEYMMFELQWDT